VNINGVNEVVLAPGETCRDIRKTSPTDLLLETARVKDPYAPIWRKQNGEHPTVITPSDDADLKTIGMITTEYKHLVPDYHVEEQARKFGRLLMRLARSAQWKTILSKITQQRQLYKLYENAELLTPVYQRSPTIWHQMVWSPPEEKGERTAAHMAMMESYTSMPAPVKITWLGLYQTLSPLELLDLRLKHLNCQRGRGLYWLRTAIRGSPVCAALAGLTPMLAASAAHEKKLWNFYVNAQEGHWLAVMQAFRADTSLALRSLAGLPTPLNIAISTVVQELIDYSTEVPATDKEAESRLADMNTIIDFTKEYLGLAQTHGEDVNAISTVHYPEASAFARGSQG
jgi:hypothetical protein